MRGVGWEKREASERKGWWVGRVRSRKSKRGDNDEREDDCKVMMGMNGRVKGVKAKKRRNGGKVG